jgi:hypothetical protein
MKGSRKPALNMASYRQTSWASERTMAPDFSLSNQIVMYFGIKHSDLIRLSSALVNEDSHRAGWASPNPSESLPSLGIFRKEGEKEKRSLRRGTKEGSLKRKREERRKLKRMLVQNGK